MRTSALRDFWPANRPMKARPRSRHGFLFADPAKHEVQLNVAEIGATNSPHELSLSPIAILSLRTSCRVPSRNGTGL